ncbi:MULTISPECIES: agmatine deiminase family protein [unclassified Leisingera]|uniref:agmatine deiminase family protein n=1 Tax=unclassified Leisingera TaxID=2614906 RepID=UPI000303B9DC|nr:MULTISPECIES: agmatine deiminase family protein [unclassified Leisingera]
MVKTPYADGFRMPARFAPHARTYIGWPTELNYRSDLARSRAEYAGVVRAVAEFEPVTVIADPGDAADARAALADCGNSEILEIPINDAWLRDSGWIFVKNDDGEVALVQFQFNGWGGKYACDKDMRVAEHLADHLGIRLYHAPFICEGGGITVDGEGTLITTEQVMRNANRYNGVSRDDLEGLLRDYLGIEEVIWLGLGLVEDAGTDGHADNVVEYLAPGVVLAQTVTDPSNPNYQLCQENLRRLKDATDAKGRKLEVIEMPRLPYTDPAHGEPMPVPYVNAYAVNNALITPMLGGADDDQARAELEGLFPGRRIVGVDSTFIALDGGGIGCITQQQPAGALAAPLGAAGQN